MEREEGFGEYTLAQMKMKSTLRFTRTSLDVSALAVGMLQQAHHSLLYPQRVFYFCLRFPLLVEAKKGRDWRELADGSKEKNKIMQTYLACYPKQSHRRTQLTPIPPLHIGNVLHYPLV